MQRLNLLIFLLVVILLISNGFGQTTWTQYTFSSTNDKLGSNQVYAVALDPTDNGKTVWIGSRPLVDWDWPGGLTKFDTQTNTWTLYTTTNSGLPEDRIWDIEFDSDGYMWIATHGGGLAKFDKGNNWTVYDESNSELGYDYIYEIEIDSEGIIWMGHGDINDRGGVTALSIFDREDQWHVFTAETTPLEDNTCYAITFGQDGLKWLGQKTGGIFSLDDNDTPFDLEDDEWTHYTTLDGLNRNTINAGSGETNINGDIWFGHDRGGGTDDYNPGCARYTENQWVNYLPDTARIRAIEHDYQGNIWLGDKGANEDYSTGLWKFDGSTWNQWTSMSSGLPNNRINTITIDEVSGIMWIGLHGLDPGIGGLAKVEGLIPPVSVIDKEKELYRFHLHNNYPNPFNPETVIEYQLSYPQKVKLTIYNPLGEQVKILVNSEKSVGLHKVIWDGTNEVGTRVGSGIYFYVMNAGDFRSIKKMIHVK
jgi:ligand-binding sensor domain-containing protein